MRNKGQIDLLYFIMMGAVTEPRSLQASSLPLRCIHGRGVYILKLQRLRDSLETKLSVLSLCQGPGSAAGVEWVLHSRLFNELLKDHTESLMDVRFPIEIWAVVGEFLFEMGILKIINSS